MENQSPSLLSCFQTIADFRRAQGRRYPLAELLVMIILSMMSGYYAYREIARFLQNNQQELKSCLGLSRSRLPSHVTIREVMMKLDFKELATAFRRWACGQGARWLSIDGKSLKSTVQHHDNDQQSFIVLVSAFCQQTGLVEEVEMFDNGKQSEIKSVQTLLGRLQQKGLLLTLDALHCQKKQ